jgi:hypothetical protein
MKRLLTILILTGASLTHLTAQTNNSPYSILGIGDLMDNYYGRTSGLANTGFAYRSSWYLINNNPASYSSIDNDMYYGEVGGVAKFVNYYGANVNIDANQSFDITFKKLVLGIKPTKHWGTSLGLLPFSSQYYQFNQPVLAGSGNSPIANLSFNGSGGVNRVYWANAYEFFHHVSIGVDLSYLFGSLQQQLILQDPNVGSEFSSTLNNVYLSSPYITYGLQVYGKIGKKIEYSLGGTFSTKTGMTASLSQIVRAPDSAVLYSGNFPNTTFTLPTTIGAGFMITYNHKYRFLGDYKFENWASAGNPNSSNNWQNNGGSILNTGGFLYQFQNSERISAGFELSNLKTLSTGQSNVLYESSFYQAGFYYTDTYLYVYGQPIRDIGATLGLGVNSKRSRLSYLISAQYGVKGESSVQLIKEKYLQFNIAFSYRDAWLTKGRKFF